jgi:membrane-associated phospholipid phosphatase
MVHRPVVPADPVGVVDDVARRAERALDPRPSAELVRPSQTLPSAVAVRRGRGAIWLAIGGLIGFGAVFAVVRAGRTAAIDRTVMRGLQRIHHPVVRTVMAAASWPGFPPQSRVIAPTAIAGLWLARLRLEALMLAGGWGTAVLSTAIKAVMQRPRPLAGGLIQVAPGRLGGTSFPSGHVITYMGVYGSLAYLAHTLIRPREARRALVGGLLGLIAAVGPSRVYAGHHWPTDVTASYLLGTSYLVGLTTLYRSIKSRRAGVTAPLVPGGDGVRR